MLDLEKVEKVLEGSPSFRIKQIWQSVFIDLIEDWSENSTLPKNIREELNRVCSLDIPCKVFKSSKNDSAKILLELEDGEKIESVLLKHSDGRRTVCVSSQVGCAMGCKFCATGRLGFTRNLTTSEIISQVLFFSRLLKREGERVTNVVFMGMGEPFLNYDNVLSAIRILNDKEAFGIGARRISISTVGILSGIDKLKQEDLQVNLAISLHAPTDELRSSLMPVNNKYSLSELIESARKFSRKKSREVMFEYLLIDGVNDSEENAIKLAEIMKDSFFVVNLIRYNPTGEFKPSSASSVKEFKKILLDEGVNVTQRWSFGQDIDAACGQLAGREK